MSYYLGHGSGGAQSGFLPPIQPLGGYNSLASPSAFRVKDVIPAGVRSHKQIAPQANAHTLVGYQKQQRGSSTPVMPPLTERKQSSRSPRRQPDLANQSIHGKVLPGTRVSGESGNESGATGQDKAFVGQGKNLRLFKSPKLGHFIQKVEQDRNRVENLQQKGKA